MDFLPGERRLIRRDGIRLFNIHYWANVLSPLAGRTKELVYVFSASYPCGPKGHDNLAQGLPWYVFSAGLYLLSPAFSTRGVGDPGSRSR